MSLPRSITGSAGSRIRVILGETGSDYLYYFDEDDGNREWQSLNWTTDSGGPPGGLCKQINNMIAKNRHITDVDFDTSGQWCVSGSKRDGSGAYSWWGGDLDVEDSYGPVGRKISLGPSSSFYDGKKSIVLNGRNGYSCSGDIDENLISRIQRMNSKKKAIKFIRLFQINNYGQGYFISDDEGTEWINLGTHLEEELKKGNDPVLDVAVASDGCWVVIRPNRFSSSTGVSPTLNEKLRCFYRVHANRQKMRSRQIKDTELEIARGIEEERARKAKEEIERQRREQERIEKEREEAERQRREDERKGKELNVKRKCDEIDRFNQIRSKRLKPMERVTAVGFSSEPGDAFVKNIGRDGAIEIFKPLRQEEGTVVIKDPMLLTPFHSTDDSHIMMLMCFATDKFEAAVSVYHCICHYGVCKCTKILSGSFLPDSLLLGGNESSINEQVSPLPRPVIENDRVMQFDEYKCAEKIDYFRLKTILDDLKIDSHARKEALVRLQYQQHRKGGNNENLKKLERCHSLEEIANKLESRLRSLPISEDGCVVFHVDYEHRDPSGRGRLFAIGDKVNVSNEKYPRTVTVQGMHNDLRAALIGKFSHDIDCENSEVRLICSLAEQLGLQHLIPTIFSYRDERSEWLQKISDSHDVSESESKRLANIILCGGRYETWLKRVCKTFEKAQSTASGKAVRKFCFNLYAEIAALRDQLLKHPRFKWTEVDREKLQKEGKGNGMIDSTLMPRIVQCCENEVLGIIHRTFHQHNWIVRTKVFDGLVVERGPRATINLQAVTQLAEDSCRIMGWDIRLIEKPLHGTHNDAIKTIVDAREVLRFLQL